MARTQAKVDDSIYSIPNRFKSSNFQIFRL